MSFDPGQNQHGEIAGAGQPAPASDSVHVPGGEPEYYADDSSIVLRDHRAGRSRMKFWTLVLATPLLLLLVAGGGGILYLYSRLASGPIELPTINQRLADALSEKAGPGLKFFVGRTSLKQGRVRPEIVIDKLSLAGANGQVILNAPQAVVSLDWLALAAGSVKPKRLTVAGLDLHVNVKPDGTLGVSAGQGELKLAPGAKRASAGASVTRPLDKRASPESKTRSLSDARAVAEILSQVFKQISGKNSQLSDLRSVGITKGRLFFNDQSRNKKTTFDDLEIDVTRSKDIIALDVSARGSAGPWRIKTTAKMSDRFNISVEAENLTLDDLALVAGVRNLPLDLDSKLAAQFKFEITNDGQLAGASGKFSSGAGILVLRDKDFEPVAVSAISGSLLWRGEDKKIVVEQLFYEAGKTTMTFAGLIHPPQGSEPGWSASLETNGPVLAAHQKLDGIAVPLDKIKIALAVEPDRKRLTLQQLLIRAKDYNFLVAGRFDYLEGNRRLQLTGQIDRSPVETVLSLWPGFIAVPARKWAMANLSGGTLEQLRGRIDFDEKALYAVTNLLPLPENSTDVRYSLSGVQVNYLPGTKPATGVHASGVSKGPLSIIEFTKGILPGEHGSALKLLRGEVKLREVKDEILDTIVTLVLDGKIAEYSSLLKQKGLSPHAPRDIDLASMRGRLQSELTMKFELARKKRTPEVKLSGKMKLSSLHIENFAGSAPLENAKLNVILKNGGIEGSGTGKLFSTGAKLKFRKSAGRALLGTIGLEIGDRERKRLGWKLQNVVSGPVGVKIAATFGKKDVLQAKVGLDFAGAELKNFAPGMAKPRGRAASASFKLISKGKLFVADNFSFKGPGVSARGSLEFNAKHEFKSARLTSLKFSPGDALRADISRTTKGMRVALTGSAIDLRSVLSGKSFQSDSKTNVKLTVRTGIATGFNGQVLGDFKLDMEKDAQGISGFKLLAKAGKSPINGRLLQRDANGPLVEITGRDAGTVLSFLDVYKKMVGGALRLRARPGKYGIAGSLEVRNFILRNEDALRKLVAQGGSQSVRNAGRRVNTTSVRFNKLQFGFQRSPTRLVIREGVLSGTEIGLTLAGSVDFGRDRVRMNGTFVPAYGLNNAFARVPLFGPLLAGGKNEGLLGVNFSVSGRVGRPVLNINPLSAIAPGFLRKIFGGIPAQSPR